MHRGEDAEMPVKSRDVQFLVDLRRNRGQAQRAAEQPGPPPGADQHGEPAGVTVAHLGQVDDKPTGTAPEQAEKLVAQGRGAGNVEFTAEFRDRGAAHGSAGKA